MTPRDQIEAKKKELQGILIQAVLDFENYTGLDVASLEVVRGSTHNRKNGYFISVDVIIKF